MQMIQSRRDFLASASLAAAAGVLGGPRSLAEEAPLETTTVRLLKESGVCDAPLYVAEELLRADGFSEVNYVHIEPGNTDAGMVGGYRPCGHAHRLREYDPEDTLRFYALRLREVDMIKSNPNTLIAEGTDWRFLNELKRELKA